MKNPRFEDDDLDVMAKPDIENICCKHCSLKAKDVKFGDVVEPGAISGICEVYDMKPDEILYDNKECPYFIDEREEEE